MINPQHGLPHGGAMAGIADVGSSNMVYGLTNGECTDGTHAAVATGARANHMGMIHGDDGYPCRGVMTRLAHVGRSIVIQRFAGRRVAVMAA